MKNNYDSRQRKIYEDYNHHSNDRLLEMINDSDEYHPEVIEIIKEILSERKVTDSSADIVSKYYSATDEREIENAEAILFREERREREEKVKSFINRLSEKTGKELDAIITRYIEYQPETVEAALYVSVEKGIISYDLKVLLLKQVESNFRERNKRFKQYQWENNNAFIQYVSRYQDDEIFNIIDDPGGIVIDVYHAILLTARQRELITDEDFTEYYAEAKRVPKTRDEIRNEVFDEFFEESFIEKGPLIEAELEAEVEKYWKCPTCGEMIEMEFNVCQKCQTAMPETIVHPDRKEVIKEYKIRKYFNPVRAGFGFIGLGLFLGALDSLFEGRHNHYVECAMIVLAGTAFVIFGLFFDTRKKN